MYSPIYSLKKESLRVCCMVGTRTGYKPAKTDIVLAVRERFRVQGKRKLCKYTNKSSYYIQQNTIIKYHSDDGQ